ncbi:MAG: ABC transporter permease [Promethearchaeota archaeon]
MKRQRIFAFVRTNFMSSIRSPMIFIILLIPITLTLIFSLVFIDVKLPNGESMFNLMVPGMITFNSLLMIMSIAVSFSKEREQGLLKRINTTPTTSAEFMISRMITNLSLAILQAVIIIILCFFLGYRPDSEILGTILSVIFIVIFSLCVIGFGLMTAAVAKNAEAAGGIAWIFIVPQLMFAAVLYPLPDTTMINILKMSMPAHYASDALILLLNGVTLTDPRIWADLAVLSMFCLVLVFAGVLLFRRYGKV